MEAHWSDSQVDMLSTCRAAGMNIQMCRNEPLRRDCEAGTSGRVRKCGATSAVVVLYDLALLPHPVLQLVGGVLDAAAG